MNALEQLIEQSHIRSASEIARRLDVSFMAVSKWRKSGRVPTKRVAALVEMSEPKLTPHDFRPDVYHPTDKAA